MRRWPERGPVRILGAVAFAALLPSCAGCGGDDAGYELAPGCLAGDLCDAIEDRGAFEGIAGFFGPDEVLALRVLAEEDDTADLWLSRSSGAEPIATGVVVSDIDLGAAGLVVYSLPRSRWSGGDPTTTWEHGRFDVHAWRPGEPPELVATNVQAYDSSVCSTGEWLEAFEASGESEWQSTPGTLALVELASGHRERLDPDTSNCFPDLGPWLPYCAARFTDDCRAVALGSERYRLLSSGDEYVAMAGDDRERASFSPGLRWLVAGSMENPAGSDSYAVQLRWLYPDTGVEGARHDVRSPTASSRLFVYDPAEAGVAVSFVIPHEGFENYPVQGLRFVELPGGEVVEAGYRARHPLLAAFTPDGATLAVLTLPEDHVAHLYELDLIDRRTGRAVRVDERAERWVPHGRRARADYRLLAFTADSRYLPYFRRGDAHSVLELAVAEVATGARRVLGSVAPSPPNPHLVVPSLTEMAHAVFSPDRRWAAWKAPDGSLQLARLDGGRPPVRVADGPVRDLALSSERLAWIERGRLKVATQALAAP